MNARLQPDSTAPPLDRALAAADADFPRRLRELAEAPKTLHVRGQLPSSASPCVAIVGARAASGHGVAAAEELAQDLVGEGWAVFSGGAVGIDAAALRGAMAGGGAAVAVLAAGLDQLYPSRNIGLFAEICARGGALATSYGPGTPVRKFHFLRRNWVLAAMVDAVVVIDASLASGALYTARAAADLGRTLGAFPGTPGCEALIAQGAAVVESANDLIAATQNRPRRPRIELPESGSAAAAVLAALRPRAAQSQEELVASTGLQPRDVVRALTGLELEGLALPIPGQVFLRSALAEELMAN